VVFYFGRLDQNNILAICIEMANSWIEHVKKFAKDNDITYSKALKDPKVKKGYVSASGKKAKPKKMETDMAMEGK